MIAAMLAWQMASGSDTSLTYRQVPPTVTAIGAYAFSDGVRPVSAPAHVVRDSDVARIAVRAGSRLVIVFTRPDGAYLLDGPFVAAADAAEKAVPAVWRRTIIIRAPPDMDDRGEVTWVPADSLVVDVWPRCVRSATRLVECWGVPVTARGVFLSAQATRAWWTLVTGPPPRDFQPSAWARLLRVADADANDSLTVTVAHAVSPPRRTAATRVQATLVPNVRVLPVAAGAVWVHGEDVPAGAWVEMRTARGGPKYLSLDEVAHAPPALPLWIALDEPRALDGIVRGPMGDPAAAALVTLFRLIQRPLSASDRQNTPHRVAVGEQVANASGEFHFDALGEADYEIVAWHPQLGRAVARVPDTGGTFMVRLEAPGHVRGRVLSAGKPLAGADVISLPDPAAFAAAEDITDVKGGDGRTGPDGRFSVVLAPGGGGELRIGGGAVPIRRIPLPRVPLPVVDLGDIDLGAPIEVSIALDRDPGCEMRATGPIGRSGLQVVSGSRTGPALFRIIFPEEGSWEIHLVCGRDERALVPGVVPITPASAGKEVRLAVR